MSRILTKKQEKKLKEKLNETGDYNEIYKLGKEMGLITW